MTVKKLTIRRFCPWLTGRPIAGKINSPAMIEITKPEAVLSKASKMLWRRDCMGASFVT